MTTQPPELDPEVRRLFTEEAEQKAGEISRGIAELNDQPNSLDRMVWLQMRFAEYSGIAKTLGLQRSGQCCAQVVDELTQVIGGARDAEDSLAALFDNALESIDNALEFLHGEDVSPHLIYDPQEDEPTVAEQLPELTFPQIDAPAGAPSPTARSQPPVVDEALLQAPPTGVDKVLMDVFFDEADELLELGENAWQDWHAGRHTDDAIKELRRVFHTLKGGARLTQMMELGDYVHEAEDWMDEAEQPEKTEPLKQRTRLILDQLVSAFMAIRAGKTATLGSTSASKKPSSQTPVKNTPPPEATPTSGTSKAQKSEPSTPRNFVRVRAQLLDNLRQRASEVNALRNQIHQVSTALQTEQQLTYQTIAEANTTLRSARFALERLIDKLPSEHSRAIADTQLESQMALQAMEDVLLRINRQTDRSLDLSSHIERALHGQSKAGAALQENILNTRLVPLSDYENRLKRIVQQTAESSNKKVELEFEGLKTEVDRSAIEQLLPALEHMLRNAVVHGIETEDQRRDAGKSPVGLIRISIRKTRGKLEIQLRDDGSGLALDKIHQKAIALGLVQADEKLSERRLSRLIFHPGLSVADELDQLAGRGVGMDVVEHCVHDLGGSIDLSTQAGSGTRFMLRLPMGETSLDAIIVHIADELYAVPQHDIRSIQRLDDQTLSRGYQNNVPIAWSGTGWQITSLGHWLGLGEGRLPGPRKSLPALLIKADQNNFAVVADYCGESAEYNVEPLPPAVTGILGLSSAVILEDGQIAPVLDLPALCGANVQYKRHHLQMAPPDPNKRFSIMLVEDSTTWLRQLSRGLSRYPFDILSGKNGEEALVLLEKSQPQLLIVDLEMPRMDGLEFLRRLRRNPKHANIPVIMFSTVTGSSQRNRARQLGAKAWVAKSANLRPLIAEIDRQLGTQFAPHEADPNIA